MSTLLQGRRALVSGAAHGLGRAYALALARAGASVAVFDPDPAVAEVAEQVRSHGGGAVAATLDVLDVQGVHAFVDRAAAELGGLDLLVNNAGIVRVTDPVHDAWDKALDDYDALMGVNVRGVFALGRAAIPHLVRQGGDLINITTDHVHTCGYPEAVDHTGSEQCPWAGTQRPPVGGGALDVYDASKWAVHGLTQVWSRALGRHGVRVNSFGMGATSTPMYRSFMGDNPLPPTVMSADDVADVLVALVAEGPTGRTGDSVQLWMGHPMALPPVSLIGRLAPPVVAPG